MKKKIIAFEAITFEPTSEADTEQRALEVLQLVKPILDSQKPFWKKQIETLFEEYVNADVADPVEMMGRKKTGLYWDFHKYVFLGMVNAYHRPTPCPSLNGGE